VHSKSLSGLTALVLDAQDSHALSAIRSLGRSGVRVTSVSPKPNAMGAKSRYSLWTLRSPNPATEARAYADWLLGILEREHFDALLFFGEVSANIVAEHRDAIRERTGCLVPDRDTFLTADRKDRVARLAATVGVAVPSTLELDGNTDVRDVAATLTYPVIVKAVWGSGGHQVRFVESAAEFGTAVDEVQHATHEAAQRCLVQQYIPGVGYGYTALAVDGDLVAAFMHRRLEEHDVARGAHLAHAASGAMSVDEPDLRASGDALLRALRWSGMAMVEFRRSSLDQRFYLMEVNPRFPGSLELAIASGVDFPSLYVQWAAGQGTPGPQRYRVGLRMRWLLSKGIAQAVENPAAYARSVASTLRTDTRCDLSLRDPGPHMVQLREAAWWSKQYVQAQPVVSSVRQIPAALRTNLRRLGGWFSRRRSYVPMALSIAVIAAMRGFTYPLGEHRLDLAWEGFCLALSLVGLTIRTLTAGYCADPNAGPGGGRSLDTTGMHSIMQQPYRFGTLLMWLGVAAFPRKAWLPAITVAAFWLYSRAALQAEAAELRQRFGAAYLEWKARTPEFLPKLWGWKRPREKFIASRALQHEPTALFAAVACLTLLEALGELRLTSHMSIDVEWAGLLTTTAVVYASLLIVRFKHSLRT
jgi:predicted ATP-grasp superfamily ATP-dependent carboligase/protein-S-isoprenylcysteine O-methyltransferase Ste14